VALVGLALATLPAACSARTPQAAPQGPRLDGEYGLYVVQAGDTLRVSWMTRAPGPGMAQMVAADGRAGPERTTPSGTAHTLQFLHPPSGMVTFRYGARNDQADRHETSIRLQPRIPRPGVSFPAVDSVLVVSDVHGELDTLKAVLRGARAIDAQDRWTGGRTHLVLVGDLMDRGPDVTAVLWFLYRLEAEAERAGGKLHIVLGNHEIMVMQADLRYVHPKESALARAHGVPYDRMFDVRRSILGRWLVSKPAILRIGDLLFAHGGVSRDYLPYTLESYDDSLAAFTSEELFHRWADSTFATPNDSAGVARRNEFFQGERSVFWYRGYAESDTLAANLAAVLSRFGARTHVVGHTPGPTIRARYDGSLIVVNTLPFAAEALLLVRRGDAWERWRVSARGRERL
jgi:hypothetical protein